MSSDLLRSAAQRIVTAFDVGDADDVQPTMTREELHRLLANAIIGLLNSKPERLMAILYRIDVSEEAVQHIFSTALPTDVPDLLADLIIDRHLAKAETRQRYRS